MIQDPLLKRFIRRAYQGGHGELYMQSTEEVKAHIQDIISPIKVQCDFEDWQPKPTVHFRIYRQPDAKASVLFVRASAYTGGGELDDTNGMCDYLRQQLQANIISLNFRAPPTYRFPIYFYDLLETSQWIFDNREQLKLTTPFLSWGESSGGGMTASLNLQLSREQRNFFDQQVLIYPLLDLVTPTDSRALYRFGYMLDAQMIYWLESKVLRSPFDRKDFRVSAGRYPNPDIPKTIMLTCECDPLRDEGETFVKQHRRLGVEVRHWRMPNMIHGFMRYYHKLKASAQAMDWIKSQLVYLRSEESDSLAPHKSPEVIPPL